MMKIKVTGLDEMQRNIRGLAKRAQDLDGTHSVKLRDLFTPAFIQSHTKHSSFDDWFKASHFKVESPEDFKAIPDQEKDDYVRSTTDFPSWAEMHEAAGAEYFRSKLFP
jgi:hypothetical protein